MSGQKSYFDRVYDRKLIQAPMAGFKMRIFVRLYNLSASAYAKPKTSGNIEETSPSRKSYSALEYRAKYVVQRLALLNRCSDDDEMCFLDYYARWDSDILKDIDAGIIEFRYARRMLNSALVDICKALRGN